MKNDHETGDDRDNRRVFAWGASAAVLVFLGALAYFYAVDKRGEAPAAPAATQSAAQPAPAAPAAPATPAR
ncbi:hypothetical protein M2282_000593 [Variovorax boronicumulans]|uniref:hypothetical protein n=1 Tax=Variovorax boronicumulans TaxID=436515 RepID=UPI002472EADF|nr:hypothetical protein [Variovorax boronicumulans]MDH6165465.1 hypothetical protein [Variovorax boronicumulans]